MTEPLTDRHEHATGTVTGRLLDGITRVEQTERGLDRLVNFSDAVVAIAITLIVLPLVDIAEQSGMTGERFLREGAWRISAAALSFVIVGALWREHHLELERAGRYSRMLVRLDLLWLAAVVFLPVPTALLFSDQTRHTNDLVADGLYVGVLLVAFTAMRLIQIEIALHCTPEGHEPLPRWRLVAEWLPVVLMAIAFVLCITGTGTKALLLVLLALPVNWVLLRLRRRAERRLAAHRDDHGVAGRSRRTTTPTR